MAPKKGFIGRAFTKALMPVFKEFNDMAAVFIKTLNRKIEAKEKKVSHIKVMVSGMYTPQTQSNISITTIDIKKTAVRKKGDMSGNQVMDWEEDFMKNRKKFII